MEISFDCVVEGHGEVEALPVLIRRIAAEFYPNIRVRIAPPVRRPRGKLVKPREVEKAVDLTGRLLRGRGAILVLLDADDDCPADLGPAQLRRVQDARGDLPSAVVLAKREYEPWFLAAAESLRGRRGLASNLVPPEEPESIRGAKEWLTRHIVDLVYSETVDQAPLTASMDLDAARGAASFAKFHRAVINLIETVRDTLTSA